MKEYFIYILRLGRVKVRIEANPSGNIDSSRTILTSLDTSRKHKCCYRATAGKNREEDLPGITNLVI